MARSDSMPVPHSWSIKAWPDHVYPGDVDRARYMIRSNRDALVAAKALTRIGRDIVVLGSGYQRWLRSGIKRVNGYNIAPNRK